MSDPRIRHFYDQVLTIAFDHFKGIPERQQHLMDHLGYMQKIFGVEVGGCLVGNALNDANKILSLPEVPEP